MSEKENEKSSHLSDHENKIIISSTRNQNGSILFMGVSELYLSKSPDHAQWYKHATGIICLVKDMIRKSYFLRLTNLNCNILWEEEIYSKFALKKITHNSCFFPGKECNVILNFAFKDEIKKFDSVISEVNLLIENRMKRRNKEESGKIKHETIKNVPEEKKTQKESKSSGGGFFFSKKAAAAKKEVKKTEIGNPINFVHMNGANVQDKTTDLLSNSECTPEEKCLEIIKCMSKKLGMKLNKTIIDEAFKVIDAKGGANAAIQEIKENNLLEIMGLSLNDSSSKPRKPPRPSKKAPSNKPPRPPPGIPTASSQLAPESAPPPPPPPPPPMISPQFGNSQLGDLPKLENRRNSKSNPKIVIDSRSELLRSIETFDRKLNPVTKMEPPKPANDGHIMRQIEKVLEDMRRYISDSESDYSTDDFE